MLRLHPPQMLRRTCGQLEYGQEGAHVTSGLEEKPFESQEEGRVSDSKVSISQAITQTLLLLLTGPAQFLVRG